MSPRLTGGDGVVGFSRGVSALDAGAGGLRPLGQPLVPSVDTGGGATGRDALSLRVAYEREETLGIRCGPDRRRAHDSRGGRKFAFDWQAAADLDTLACS